MPVKLVKDSELIRRLKEIKKKCLENREAIEHIRSSELNPQTVYKSFKNCIIKEIHDYSKKLKPKILKEIVAIKRNLQKTQNDPALDEDMKRAHTGILDY